MNGPFVVAQAGSSSSNPGQGPVQIIKIKKPADGETEIYHASFTGTVKIDLTAIANDKITFWKDQTNQSLHILFLDNANKVISQAIIEPFFFSMGVLSNLVFDVGPGQILDAQQFSSQFTFSTEANLAPAAGTAPLQGSLEFAPPVVDPLLGPEPLPLLPPEVLPTFVLHEFIGVLPPPGEAPVITTIAASIAALVVEESFIPQIGSGQPPGPPPSNIATATVQVSVTNPVGPTTFALELPGGQGTQANVIDSVTGNHVFLFLENGVVVGREGTSAALAVGGPIDFTIGVDGSGTVTVTLLRGLTSPTQEAGADASEAVSGAAGLVTVTATNNGVSASFDLGPHVFLLDDGPIANSQVAAADTLVVDESAVGTDTPVGIPRLGLASTTANFADNFSTANIFGADGPGPNGVLYSLQLAGSNVASGLFALDNTNLDPAHFGQGAQIVLNQSGNTVTGSAGGTTYFTISIDPVTGIVTFAQSNNIWHGDPNNPDDQANLTLANANQLQVVQTITDTDGDSASTAINVGQGVFAIQDDGPTASKAAAAAPLVLDESPLNTDTPGGILPVGTPAASENFAALFSGGSFGTDGPGSTTYSLHLTGSNVNSGLFALQPSDVLPVGGDGDGIGQGDQIVLNINAAGDTVTGSVGATNYFTIHIDAVTGIVTFAQSNNIWHGDPNNPDDQANLTLASADLLQVVQTIVDADGDHVSTPINVGTGVFAIQDDGPTASVAAAAAPLVLDETRPEGTDTIIHTPPSGLASTTENFAALFSGGTFGT